MTMLSSGPWARSIEDLLAAYGALVDAIQAAAEPAEPEKATPKANHAECAEATRKNNDGSVSSLPRLLYLLQSKYAAIRAAASKAKEDPAAIIRCAHEACGLAKNLDFFRLDFLDAQRRKQVDDLVTRVVVSAYAVSIHPGPDLKWD